ncbi:hypothetical protein [Haloarchaeobius sp. DFWS5]|uniref:hypothetical protein n=1 Tax=Haloarchaeobius sp. DFWS5 TaxID=3446114 RepID=UPI003EBD1AE0
MKVREFFGVSESTQRAVTRLMQTSLVGLFFVGLYEGNVGIVVNAGVGVGVTQLPAILERDYEIPMDAGLTLWITAAAFLHALGTAGLPGMSRNLYLALPWWDHVTHTLSASLVAAAGYATVRALDLHRDDIYLPPEFTLVFVLSFVLAFGVLWEVLEFVLGLLGDLLGGKAVLTQFGVEDTMVDLVFDMLGGIVVAVWGQAHLTDVVGAMHSRFEDNSP